jgi:enoyl-CoA hydratase/carnithine racemase
MTDQKLGDVTVVAQGAVALVTFARPPDNYFDRALLENIADGLAFVDTRPELRSVVLASEGKSFCAGANFSGESLQIQDVYQEGLRIFSCAKPIVAAIQGAAIGGGLGLALTADFRIVSTKARFSANFAKIGIHPGFGLTHMLPRLIGEQKAALLMLTGRRVTGEEAIALGLADELVSHDLLIERAIALASEIADGAPLAVQSTRATLRRGLVEALQSRLEVEITEQLRLFATNDFREGVAAVTERRPGNWTAS